MIRLCR